MRNFLGLTDGWCSHSVKSRFRAVRGGQTGTARHHGAPETGQAAPDPHQPSVLSAPEFEQAQAWLGGMGGENEGAEDGHSVHQLQLRHRNCRNGHNHHGQRAVDGHGWT